MEIRDFIIGIMGFIVFITIVFSVTLDVYSPTNLNIDFEDDNSTKGLTDLQNKIESEQAEIQSNNQYISERTVGGEKTELGKDVTEDNLISSSLTALTSVPSYIGSFFNLIGSISNTIGSGIGAAISQYLWFFIGAITVIIAFILLSSVLRNRL